MANAILIGGSPAVAQVHSETPASVDTDGVYTIPLSNEAGQSHTISFTAANDVEADVVAGLYAEAVAAKTAGYAPWDEVTTSNETTYLKITADAAGTPFYVGTPGATTGTLTDAEVTANSGPTVYSLANNWLAGAIPVNTNDVILPAGMANAVSYGLNQASVLLASLTHEKGCNVGVGASNVGSNVYLQIDADNVYLHTGTTSCYYDIDNSTLVQVSGAGRGSLTTGVYGLNLKGTSNAALTVLSTVDATSSISIAKGRGESAAFTTISIAGGIVDLGNAVTMTTLIVKGGAVSTESSATTLTFAGGSVTLKAASAFTTVTVNEDLTLKYESAGTIAALTLQPNAVLDCRGFTGAHTLTNCTRYPGSRIVDPNKTLTFTNAMQYPLGTVGCSDDLGEARTLAVSDI